MKVRNLHAWDLSVTEATELQYKLAGSVICHDKIKYPIRHVAGVDAGYDKSKNLCRAVVVILRFPELCLIENVEVSVPVGFPYVPGLLSFRETPAVIEALRQVKTEPEVIFCDGQGLAHPRRFGIACHIGLLTEIPTIGVAKSLLVGEYVEPEQTRRSYSFLQHKSEVIGAVVRTKSFVKPVYVSIGHLISLETAVRLVLDCTKSYRLPEPVRLADKIASKR